MSGDEQNGEAITAQGMEDLNAEIEDLESRGRLEMAERIKVAREMGDLKENAEYHIAKEDQAHLETKIKRLRERRRDAVVVDVDEGRGGVFSFGRSAEVSDDTGSTHTWTLVGPTEADLTSGRLSAESPVGRGLRDHAAGETVEIETPKGKRSFTIKAVHD